MGKGKRKRRDRPIKWSFIFYIPISVVVAYGGSYAIGIASNYLQCWNFFPGIMHWDWKTWFWLAGNLQMVLIPLWVLFTFVMTGAIFYKRELKEPIEILVDAATKIADNRLDFSITYHKNNELGMLCQSFEKMRSILYRNHQEMWRMLEERKSVNAAFSHDMRTPITVLKGYRDLLEKYIPGGEVPEEKVMEILKMMGSQIDRLESYTQKMNALQKLEDIIPEPREADFRQFTEKCREIGDMLSGNLQMTYTVEPHASGKKIRLDEELVLEVYENLLSNAVRYASRGLEIGIVLNGGMLKISVEDDGTGFTPEALRQAAKPFYRAGTETWGQDGRIHFGVGLSICKVICEKCHGTLLIENGRHGGKVTACFGNTGEDINRNGINYDTNYRESSES